MARRIVDLTFPIHNGMTTYPVHWHPLVEVTQMGRLGMEGRESRRVVMGTHTGTHVDAPVHFIDGAASIDQIPLDVFMGPASILDFSWAARLQELGVADLEKALGDRPAERVILRYDWSDQWGKLHYYQQHPYLSDDAARWLVGRGVRLLGLDAPQADDPRNGRGTERDSPVHKILLGAGIIKLEYLTNLRALRKDVVEISALPLKIRDGDGAPVRCVAIEND